MEAVAQPTPETASDRTTTTGGGVASDRLRVHAHLYKPRLKTSSTVPDFQAELRQYASKQGRNAALEYATALGNARRAFLMKAETPATSDVEAALDQAAEEYISLLIGLVNALPKPKKGADSKDAGKVDEVEELASEMESEGAHDESATAPKAPSSNLPSSSAAPATSAANGKAGSVVKGDSKLRRGAVGFEWKDVMLTPPTSVTARDAIYELGCVLEAVALWKMARAAQLCADSRQGTPGEAVSQAYRLLRAAAGIFDFVRDHCATFLINAVDTKDCNCQTAQAFSLACIAEGQALTVLRAVQKGNAPTLIASLATDASAAFKSAAGTAGGVVSGGKADSKFVLYCEYQAAAMEAVALAFTGQDNLTSQQVGTALAYLGKAKSQLAAAQSASKAYDRAQPVTSATEHEYADLELRQTIDKPYERAERDNKSVFFQHVPAADSLAAIQPRRLVNATAYALPAPAALVNDTLMESFAEVPPDKAGKMTGAPAASAAAAAGKKEEEGKEGEGQEPDKAQPKGGAWWQWLLVFIAMPFLVVISLVGAVVWLVLLPLKCLCCPIGCAAQLLWSAVEWLLKAPFRALLWASGKPWKPEKPEELKAGSKAADAKKNGKDKVPPV